MSTIIISNQHNIQSFIHQKKIGVMAGGPKKASL
jgi:hypothetical protein